MIKQVFILVFVTQILAQVEDSPFTRKNYKCYQWVCPAGTAGCKKVVKTSDDKKTITTTTTCLDGEDMALKNFIENKENPYGPSTTFHSTSYSRSYVAYSKGGNHNVHAVINNENNNVNDGLEDFS